MYGNMNVFVILVAKRIVSCNPIYHIVGSLTRLQNCFRELVQTIFRKINVIVTLWGEGVIGHDV